MVRARRKFSSLAFSMQKAYQKILNIKLPWLIVALVAVAASIFLLGGGVYDIIERPIAIVPGGAQGRWIYFWPYELNRQLLNESIVVMLLYTIGFLGFAAMYQSTKYAYKPRQAFILLLVGAVLVILAYFGCETTINLKLQR